MRAISTVLDVSLCLLLVSASALTLAGTPAQDRRSGPPTAPDSADEAATLVATSTASVTYRPADSANENTRNRTVHDTLAGLLASASAANAEPESATDFVRAATATVGRALRRAGISAQVVARPSETLPTSYSPTSQSTPERSGRVVAGPAPPPDADVYAAAVAVREVRLTVRTWSR
ncbi:DUF7284 family protein [Halorussus pelagicus]|uniref:DUF7284 family protein n=1 Tax=Halorussus pelagicus TaxID=2505977 RepID=UPI000FFB912B|nr:hypothetical protein [Halorussus pelagicus]